MSNLRRAKKKFRSGKKRRERKKTGYERESYPRSTQYAYSKDGCKLAKHHKRNVVNQNSTATTVFDPIPWI